MTQNELLSVVVTAYTAERLQDIYRLLDSLKAQTYVNLEILFIAERSRDLLGKIRSYGIEHQIANLKVLFNEGEPGLSEARNLGIQAAGGDIIAFVDDDVVLYPDWAERMVEAYDEDSIIGVTGPALPLWEDQSMSWFPEEFYWIISCTAWAGWESRRVIRNAWGMNMSFRREAFEKSGNFLNEFGFHKGSMAEDNEFSLRVRNRTGKRIIYCPLTRVRHRVHSYRLSRNFIKERACWIGFSRRTLKSHSKALVPHKTDTLDQEHQLLNRIFTRLFPAILLGFFSRPVNSWRKLRVTLIILYYVAISYYGLWRPPAERNPLPVSHPLSP
jgi:glucosyl-dolichyl phosphate glucuronosyltransferase